MHDVFAARTFSERVWTVSGLVLDKQMDATKLRFAASALPELPPLTYGVPTFTTVHTPSHGLFVLCYESPEKV